MLTHYENKSYKKTLILFFTLFAVNLSYSQTLCKSKTVVITNKIIDGSNELNYPIKIVFLTDSIYIGSAVAFSQTTGYKILNSESYSYEANKIEVCKYYILNTTSKESIYATLTFEIREEKRTITLKFNNGQQRVFQ